MTVRATARARAITLGRASARRWGTVSASRRALPDFLVVGGQRCGTTSMFKTLLEHPSVVGPPMHKGIHFFDTVDYARGLDWYRGQFPLRATMERRAKGAGGRAITGESSPYYGVHPLAASRIAAALPDVKLLLLIRDPVERAFSAHTHETARGYEDQPFVKALDLESERTTGERERILADPAYESFSLRHHAYTERGQYVEQVERLTGIFGKDRVHVVDADKVFVEPMPVMTEVFDHLGLARRSELVFRQHNARPRSPMAEDVRERLQTHFRPYDEKLVEVLGWVPRWMD
jgi:Sulfotransferase domain